MKRLSTQQRIIAWRLLEDRIVTWGELIHALWGERDDGGPEWADNHVKVQVFRLRGFLAAYGVAVKTNWGFGPCIAREQISKAREVLAAEIAANHRWPVADTLAQASPLGGRGFASRRGPKAPFATTATTNA